MRGFCKTGAIAAARAACSASLRLWARWLAAAFRPVRGFAESSRAVSVPYFQFSQVSS